MSFKPYGRSATTIAIAAMGLLLLETGHALATTVTVVVLSGDSAPAQAAQVALLYPENRSVRAMTDNDGSATLEVPVDPSLASLQISTQRGVFEYAWVDWLRSMGSATITIRLRDRAPYSVTVQASLCISGLRPRCSPFDGHVSLYDKLGTSSVTLANNPSHDTNRITVPYPPDRSDVWLVGSDGAVDHVETPVIVHTTSEDIIAIQVWRNR